jgi:hypothetical protein
MTLRRQGLLGLGEKLVHVGPVKDARLGGFNIGPRPRSTGARAGRSGGCTLGSQGAPNGAPNGRQPYSRVCNLKGSPCVTPGMKELLRQVLETAPSSDRKIMAAAVVSSAVLLTLATTIQLVAL